jgi:23S rRNA (adenine2503-C2)-methyltransferase
MWTLGCVECWNFDRDGVVSPLPWGEPPANYRRVIDAVHHICDPAPDDELRDTLVPVNTRWKVSEVLQAARGYADKTGRRVSIEYALIRDVNDQGWRADMLGKKLRKHLGQYAHVNLIPLNPTPGSEWDASPKPVQDEFVQRVKAQGVECTVWDTRGQEIAAACGQLAAEG